MNGGLGGHGDLKALLVAHRITIGRQNHAAGVFIGELDLCVRQCTIGAGAHDGEQVAFQQRQHHLGLGVTEAAVVLDDLGALGREHQAEVQTALEGTSLGVHGGDGGQEDGLHAPVGDFGGVVGVGRHGAHAAGVQAGVVVADALVIHGGHHGLHHVTVSEGQHGNLGAGEELLDNHPTSGFTEHSTLHHIPDCLFGFLPGLGNDDALAQRQTVGLDHGRHGSGVEIAERRVHVLKNRIFRRGNAVLFHQILGKHLAALDDGGICPGPEAGNVPTFQRVHAAQHQRVIRSHHSVIDGVLHGKLYDAVKLGRSDGNAGGVSGNAAVSGQGEDFGDFGILFQTFDDSVFTTATTDNHKLH